MKARHWQFLGQLMIWLGCLLIATVVFGWRAGLLGLGAMIIISGIGTYYHKEKNYD